jgi:hypothetical protein
MISLANSVEIIFRSQNDFNFQLPWSFPHFWKEICGNNLDMDKH